MQRYEYNFADLCPTRLAAALACGELVEPGGAFPTAPPESG